MKSLRRLSFVACLLLSIFALAEPARSAGAIGGGPVGSCTCAKKEQKCIEQCSLCNDCVAIFTCNTADPCQSSCRCKVINP